MTRLGYFTTFGLKCRVHFPFDLCSGLQCKIVVNAQIVYFNQFKFSFRALHIYLYQFQCLKCIKKMKQVKKYSWQCLFKFCCQGQVDSRPPTKPPAERYVTRFYKYTSKLYNRVEELKESAWTRCIVDSSMVNWILTLNLKRKIHQNFLNTLQVKLSIVR